MLYSEIKRWLYRGQRPNGIARMLNGAWAVVASSGIASHYVVTLEVTGRRSGRTASLPVVVALGRDSAIWYRCWESTSSGFRMSVPPRGERSSATAAVRRTSSKRCPPTNALRSSRRTSSAPMEPGPMCPSTKMRPWRHLNRWPRISRCSGGDQEGGVSDEAWRATAVRAPFERTCSASALSFVALMQPTRSCEVS